MFGKTVGYIKAVDGVSFNVTSGEVLSLVGESGSGKTTIAKCILLLEKIDGGKIIFDGHDIEKMRGGKIRALRRNLQAVFQNPFLSLDPR